MFTRQPPDTRIVLALIIVAFLAGMAWWWSLRAGRIEAGQAPTPSTLPAATPAPSGATAP
jgi:hypothetical protein